MAIINHCEGFLSQPPGLSLLLHHLLFLPKKPGERSNCLQTLPRAGCPEIETKGEWEGSQGWAL